MTTIRQTHQPESADVAVRRLLDGGDADRLATMIHNLLTEVADLTLRVRALEAHTGHSAPQPDAQTVQSVVGEVVERVTR